MDADLCPRRFWFRKVHKRRTLPAGASVGVGTAAHAVLHEVARGARDDKALLDALAANPPELGELSFLFHATTPMCAQVWRAGLT